MPLSVFYTQAHYGVTLEFLYSVCKGWLQSENVIYESKYRASSRHALK